MRLSAGDWALIGAELAETLQGLPLRQIHSHVQGFSLEFAAPGVNLCWQLAADHCLCLLYSERPETQPPTAFVMLLRKHLQGRFLQTVSQPGGDRVLRLEFAGPAEAGTLVLELMGRHSNVFLLGPQDQLLASLRPDRRSTRSLKPGERYRAPQPLAEQRPPVYPELALLSGDGGRSAFLRTIWQAWEKQHAERVQCQQLERGLKQGLHTLRTEIQRCEQGLDALTDAEVWQQRGELLQAARVQLKPGSTCVRVINYFDPQLQALELPLDPRYDLQTNAQRCFRQARRLRKQGARAEVLLPELWEKEAALLSLQQAYQQLLAEPPAATLAAALQNLEHRLHTLCPFSNRPSPQAPQAARRPWREFVSRRGDRIRVGRSGRDNLTLLRQSRGNDLWLHQRNAPGAHVVIPLAGKQEPDSETLLDGAALALHYSSRPQESPAEILWTRVKYLRPSRGGTPGEVQILQSRVLIYRAEATRLQRLLQGEAETLAPPEL